MPAGEMKDGSLVDIYNVPAGGRATIFLPGPTPCVAQQLILSEDEGKWAQTTMVTFDFSKVAGVRYLADADDFASAPSRSESDPAITTANLDGAKWNCQRVVGIDPAQPRFDTYCNDGWTVVFTAPNEAKAVQDAINRIGAACFKK
jgi:hypothetical protein